MKTEFRIKQFEKFYHFLMKNPPKDYVPWFFPCKKEGKDPCPEAIIKIDNTSKGSWHHKSARLSKEQCIEHIKQNYNLGISARKDDPLIIGDVDEPEVLNQMPKDTLTTKSRKRCGGHFFGWDKDGSAKINLPTDQGEMRSDNQYVLSPGSYVPFDMTNKKDKKTFDGMPDGAKEDKLIGYYTINEPTSPREMSFDDLPKFFKEKESENIEAEAKIKNRETSKEFSGEGKYSELFKLKVSDIIGLIPKNKRVGHPLHESDTDANWSLTDDGSLGHCWRHLVSLNAVQYLCVRSGYAKCEDAGTPHKGRGLSKIKGDKKAYAEAYKEAIKLKLIEEYKPKESGEGYIEVKTKDGSLFNLIGSGKFGKYVKIDAVVEVIRGEYDFVTIYGKKGEDIWTYEDGIYKPTGREIIQTYSENLLETFAKTKTITEIVNKIKRQTSLSRDEFDNIPKELLPLRNGILNFETNDFIDYNPKYYFKTKIDVKYNKEAKCEKWIKFVNSTFYPEDVPVIQEWFGFCLYRDYFIKKGFIGVGIGDTGKSVFQNVLLKFFGVENTSGLNLQKIVRDDNFSKSSLYNKYVNLYDDMSSKDINEGGGLKMVTGRSPITAEYKFGDEFQFINFAKMTFCCNKIPEIKEADDLTYYYRWLPIPFDNVVPEKDQDKFLSEKLTTDEELSGILNWGLEGLKRLIKNSRFSYNKSPEEIKNLMDRNSTPLAEFTFDCLEECEGSKVTKEIMFRYYTEWAKMKNKSRETIERLGRNLPRYAKFIIAGREGNVRYWDNVKFKEGNDTYDTILKKQGGGGLYILIQGLDKKLKKVSYPSQTAKQNNDTYDTFSKEPRPKCSIKGCNEYGVLIDKDKSYCMEHSK